MYKRIMVAVDGSSTSKRTLHEATNFAKDVGGQLCIAYVVDEATYWVRNIVDHLVYGTPLSRGPRSNQQSTRQCCCCGPPCRRN
jgi:nucleotide-binding universal stress UspA family protein